MTASVPRASDTTFANSPFLPEEMVRYSRHFRLPEVGTDGQTRLKRARVLLVGAGGLGSPAALYLAAAGVGTIGILDFDGVELSNLQRQIIHGTSDIGRAKTASAEERIHDINPHVSVERFDARLTSVNALEIIDAFDVVVDGSDNFPTRYVVNDAAVISSIPYVYGSIERFHGQASVFAAPDGPCYRCLFREPPPAGAVLSCAEAGVLGVLPGIVGTIQATEALKLILGIGEPLIGRLLLIDSLEMRFRTVSVRRDPECPTCGDHRSGMLVDHEQLCATSEAGDDDAHADDSDETGTAADFAGVVSITPKRLAQRLASGDDIDVIDVREPYEWAADRLPTARLIPLGDIEGSLEKLRAGREIVLYCKMGARSHQAAAFLVASGLKNVSNLAGGIDRWRAEVDQRPSAE
jgi:molybdopterin/thiamine biosynthesis adenylyltransferase/rhodanese-related sulfurtransferase